MRNRKGLLMRVGIDQSKETGGYNAPINPITNDYFYLPIKQGNDQFKPGLETGYKNLYPFFKSWSQRNKPDIQFPQHLNNETCHLDPDFEFSTYGDQETGRGLRVAELKEWDFIVFFASFNPIKHCEHKLIYALFGIMVVDNIVKVRDIPESDHHKNAHTRIMNRNDEHLVVFAKPSLSGRFDRAIPIGEFRNRSYRVKNEILDAWGNIGVNDGFIQRSVCPPWFEEPELFLKWLESQQVKLINNNWS